MKALKYKITIYESVLGYVHGQGLEITELAIPIDNEYIVMNYVSNKLNVFKSKVPRCKGVEVEVDINDTILKDLKKFISLETTLKEKVYNIICNIFGGKN